MVHKLGEIRKELSKATHHAYAYRFWNDRGCITADCHDDGEVHRTAGQPILQVLGNNDVINVVLVVTRYYGRIHLGPAGLIRMYRDTAKDLLDNIPLMDTEAL